MIATYGVQQQSAVNPLLPVAHFGLPASVCLPLSVRNVVLHLPLVRKTVVGIFYLSEAVLSVLVVTALVCDTVDTLENAFAFLLAIDEVTTIDSLWLFEYA